MSAQSLRFTPAYKLQAIPNWPKYSATTEANILRFKTPTSEVSVIRMIILV